MQSPPTRSFPRAAGACPTCGAPAEPGQLVCLECGSRVALDYRRPPSWRVAVAIIAVVVLLVAGISATLLKGIGGDAEREVGRTPIKVRRGAETKARAKNGTERAPAKRDTGAKTAPKKETPSRPPAATPGELVRQGSLYSWPRAVKGFTVVLLSTEDRGSAERFARSASKDRPAKIGVIRADDFKTLEKGFFVVFAGRYEKRARADRAAARLGRRFPGAFPQLVER